MGTRIIGARKPRDTYFELVKRFPLLPLRSDADLRLATAVLEELATRKHRDPDEEGYLDVLSDLVEQYEMKHHGIDTDSIGNAEMLAFLIERKGVTQADVSRATGIAPQTVSEILAGKRHVPKARIVVLAEFFGLRPSVFFTTATL